MVCAGCAKEIDDDSFFCVYCGSRVEEQSHRKSRKVWEEQERSIIAACCACALVLAAYLISLQTGSPLASTLVTIIIIFFPVILGAIVVLLKIEKAVSCVEAFNHWTLRKKAGRAGRKGFINAVVFKPLLWTLARTMQWTEGTGNVYLRSAIRIAAYIYLIGIVLYISITIVFVVIALIVTCWIISLFSDGEIPPRKTGGRRRLENTNLYDTKGFFAKKMGYIDEKGNIYDSSGLLDTKVGRIDEDGRIYDTRGLFANKVMRIDDKGNVYDTTGFLDSKVGEVDEKGTIRDTKGFFSKKIGKAEKK